MTSKVSEPIYIDFEFNSAGLTDVVVKVIKCTTAGVLTDFTTSVSAVTEITTGTTTGWYKCNFTPDEAAFYFWRARSASTGKYVGGLIPVGVGMLADTTYGLSALQVLLAAIDAKTTDLAYTTGNINAHIMAKDPALALSAQEMLDVNTELDSALNTAIPGSPVADSVNERLQTLDDLYNATVAGRIDAAITTRASQASLDSVDTNVDILVQRAQCDAAMAASTTDIYCLTLANYGDDYFNNGWQLCILQNVNSHGASPENQWRDIVDYTSLTGKFVCAAFGAEVEEYDYIMIARDEFVAPSAATVDETQTVFSAVDDIIDLSETAADVNLPNIILPNIAGTLTSVIIGIKFRQLENTSALGSNALNGAWNIRIKKSTGTWGVDDVVAVALVDNQWQVAASAREGGDIVIGDVNCITEVDAFNETYNLRFEDIDVDLDYLRLIDVQVFALLRW